MARLFGYTISKEEDKTTSIKSIVSPKEEDGSIEVAPGGAYGTYVDFEGRAQTETQLINKYRQISLIPECDSAIQDIVNESIVISTDGEIINIIMDKLDQPDRIKNKIADEFKNILKMLNFDNFGYDIFKKWYVDGRLYYHIVIDDKNPRGGIKGLYYVDPRKVKKITVPKKEKDDRTNAFIYKAVEEYYIYNPKGIGASTPGQQQTGIKISKDSFVYVHSGLFDYRNSTVYSHLHKAIKPLNQLHMLEDATVIYRLSRAPERRIFYIDVGNLPKLKAEQYMRDMMAKHKNKLVYNAQTGEVQDDRKFMTMLEDFWLPRREGGKGTEITTLPAGQNLGEMDDVEYFRKKLYKSLNVPITRIDPESQFNIGRSSEITRDEVKFSKFIKRLRNKFSNIFDDILEIHLSLKGICTRDEWDKMKQDIYYDFQNDNHFTEIKEAEIMRDRLQLLTETDSYHGKYFSKEWIEKNILRLSDDDIKEIAAQIKKEEPIEQVDSDAPPDRPGNEPSPPPAPEPPEPKEVEPKEEVANTAPLTEEEKRLVDSMTKFMDSMATTELLSDDIPLDNTPEQD
jgi:hypothetical protein